MKRILFLISAFLFITSSFAESLRVTLGDASVLNQEVSAFVVFSYEECTWEEDEDFNTRFGRIEYDEALEAMRNSFIESFNKNSKGLIVTDSDKDSQFTITIKALDFYQRTGSMMKKSIRVDAYIEIVDNKSGETVCKITAKRYEGGVDYVSADRFGKCYSKLAEGIAKQKFDKK